MNGLLPGRLERASKVETVTAIPMAAEPVTEESSAEAGRQAVKGIAADLCYFVLRLSGWLALTLLATLGLYTVFFMALGAFSAEGFFAHVANLSVRFGDADHARQGLFVRQLVVATLILFLAVSAARYRSLAAIFSAASAARKE